MPKPIGPSIALSHLILAKSSGLDVEILAFPIVDVLDRHETFIALDYYVT